MQIQNFSVEGESGALLDEVLFPFLRPLLLSRNRKSYFTFCTPLRRKNCVRFNNKITHSFFLSIPLLSQQKNQTSLNECKRKSKYALSRKVKHIAGNITFVRLIFISKSFWFFKRRDDFPNKSVSRPNFSNKCLLHLRVYSYSFKRKEEDKLLSN